MFAKRLVVLRKNKNVSQYELAKLLNLSRGQIANYEQGKRQPDYDILKMFADFFGVSTDYLLGRTDDPIPPQPKAKKPNYEEYVLSAGTLADAAIRISELNGRHDFDEKTFLELHMLAYKKFGLKPVKSADDAAHTKHNAPATGVFEDKH